MEGLSELERVDELRVETRCHLDTHTAQEKPQVHVPKIGLLVPWHLVLRNQAGDDGVGSVAYVDHVGGIGGCCLIGFLMLSGKKEKRKQNRKTRRGSSRRYMRDRSLNCYVVLSQEQFNSGCWSSSVCLFLLSSRNLGGDPTRLLY